MNIWARIFSDEQPVFDPGIFGCGNPDGFSYKKNNNATRVQPIKGRSRYRLRDVFEPYRVDISYTFTRSQYEEFQRFFSQDIDHGAKWFVMPLILDKAADLGTTQGYHQVKMIAPYDAANPSWDLWSVTLYLEVKSGPQAWATCDDIYGGPIDNLASDNIYGGPIDGLAEDIIAPCPGIDPSGVET